MPLPFRCGRILVSYKHIQTGSWVAFCIVFFSVLGVEIEILI
jgi:hypothetical protein